NLAHNLTTFKQMIQGLLLDTAVRVAQRPKPVFVVLEDIGVDCADAYALFFGIMTHAQIVVILRTVPRDMDGNRGGNAGQFVDFCRVIQLFLGGLGGTWPGKGFEASATVGIAPTWCLDLVVFDRTLDCLNINPLICEVSG